ncbi:TPA: winged helix-turn-helix transcriptional regulator [Klebsiella michiganensis]|uniref:MarR family winged helix-turn-helix transcriptional regulator n=1 Tax=Klebsiella michiganensis TaxID=1134687 RepID=UPI00046999B6|nr:MarR family winged helix-turn-helix transcriptional regulator [Klebsiella michiganensis]EKQ6536094.1 winged helix-turn-helix transcriptional regulator [Klebsiella michiganensis]ELQ7988137.1 winged helix-turn-helix transcriptional regulator [Klebsiella michiganensis]MBZ7916851.1 winged helix-turn-helix transcriptional regulator [Klebsiella michiganensis]MCW9597311.1 MarR family winged helix-turn-helix transcriptional regulator [Klebsiella michiganensis]HDX9238812.1 winged helix-turn-helix tr
MNLNQLKQKYQYVDKDGATRDRTLNIPHYFEEIPFIHSPHLEKGRVKFSPAMQKLYCYVADWEKSGCVCHETQSELAKVCGLSRSKTNDLIELMERIGLITRTKIPGRRNKELRALPLTDAHIIPPEALALEHEMVSNNVQYQSAPTTELKPDNTAEEHSTTYWGDIPCVWDDPDYQSTPTIPIQQDKPELPWGGVSICKSNGQPPDAAVEWALNETMGNEEAAYQLISTVVSAYTGRTEVFIPRAPEVYDDYDPIPF